VQCICRQPAHDFTKKKISCVVRRRASPQAMDISRRKGFPLER
jgi:hypothetical protein